MKNSYVVLLDKSSHEADSSSKISFQIVVSSFPPTIGHNDRGYGHLAVCGSIRCRGTTKWMREQNRRNARQPANEHRRVLCVRCLVVYVCLSIRIFFVSSFSSPSVFWQLPAVIWQSPWGFWQLPSSFWQVPSGFWQVPCAFWLNPSSFWQLPSGFWQSPWGFWQVPCAFWLNPSWFWQILCAV